MTGQGAFKNMVTETTTTRVTFYNHISQDDYELWLKDVIWDCLHGLRYGQSFCNRFNITDNILYYNSWPQEQIDSYIKKNYLANN